MRLWMRSGSRKRPSLVAHSGGTLIGPRVALSYPQRVSRLVLTGAAITSDSPGPIAYRLDNEGDKKVPMPLPRCPSLFPFTKSPLLKGTGSYKEGSEGIYGCYRHYTKVRPLSSHTRARL